MEEKIKDYLAKEIAPLLQRDGGDIEFIGYEDGIVKVQLQGACQGCPGARMTLKQGVEQRLKSVFNEIKSVEAV